MEKMLLKTGLDNRMSGDLYEIGDLVQLRSGLRGIVVAVDLVGAKNTVGRAGVVEVVEVMTERGEIGRALSHQLEGVRYAALSQRE